MLNNILNLKGVQTLNKKEQQSIMAGTADVCHPSDCGGTCVDERCINLRY